MKAKKSLGQNFLKSSVALNKIIEAGEVNDKDIVLEIGPGKGALTAKLLEKAGVVIAVEKDRELFDFLKEKFAHEISEKKLFLLNEDILEVNIKNIWENIREGSFGGKGGSGQRRFEASNLRAESANIFPDVLAYKIIANIPYNITGAILKKFLTEEDQPERMILMVQHEVAKRIVARDKKESILSISVKAYGEPKLVMKVAARYFSPAPKVDSAIIAINNISKSFLQEHGISEEKFWEIVKIGFAHKRKKLSSNLKSILKNKADLAKTLGNKRAEDLSLLEWIKLTKDINN